MGKKIGWWINKASGIEVLGIYDTRKETQGIKRSQGRKGFEV